MTVQADKLSFITARLGHQRNQLTIFLYGLAGGFGDATSFLRFKTFTGHVTGHLVLMMISVSTFSWNEVLERLLAVLFFLVATRFGFWIGKLQRNTTWLFVFQAVLLIAQLSTEWIGLTAQNVFTCLFATVLGLQNGVITQLDGVCLHSTFISGDFTNLLMPLLPDVKKNAAREASASRFSLGLLIGGFASGALSAAMLNRTEAVAAVGVFMLILAVAYCSTLKEG